MSTHTVKADMFYRTNAKIRSIAGYGALLARNLNGFLPLDSDSSSNRLEKELNPLLTGYPRNHNYRIYKKKLFPSFKLYERLRLVVSLYPQRKTRKIQQSAIEAPNDFTAIIRLIQP